MNCQVFIANRQYSQPGNCARQPVRAVRWAPTPLLTKVYMLCPLHKRLMEDGRLKFPVTHERAAPKVTSKAAPKRGK